MRRAGPVAGEEYIGLIRQRAAAWPKSCKGRIDVAFAVRMEDMELQSRARAAACASLRLGLGSGTGRVVEQGNHGSRGHHLVQQLQPFRP